MRYVNINGKLIEAQQAPVAHDNRAFRYGYGLFETMLCKNGNIELADLHWQRLFAGMEQLHFEVNKLFTAEWLESEVLKTVAKNKLEKLCRVRLQVYTDSGGLYDGHSQQPQYVIECFPLEDAITQLNENGLIVGIANGLSKSKDSLANLKTTNALIYAMGAQQARQNKWNDALIRNTEGSLIESTIANIFIVRDQIIYTPPLEEGCVAGVMRSHLLLTIPDLGYTVEEGKLSIEDVNNCDEIMLTNAIRRIKWVSRLGDKEYTNSTAAKLYRQLFT